MKIAIMSVAILMTAACAFGQSEAPKPEVNVAKMTDAEYKRLDDASVAMQKAAEAYRKAADEYKSAKESILGKYNALESKDCSTDKIVDVRGQYIIVEIRHVNSTMLNAYFSTDGSLIGCGSSGFVTLNNGSFITN